MSWQETYQPLIGARLSGMAFMCIGADALRVVANSLGSPSLWFAGALRFGFDGHEDNFVTTGADNGSGFLSVSAKADWLPYSLADIPIWTGSWSEFLEARLGSVALYGLDAAVASVNYKFERNGTPGMELWASVGLEDMDAIGDGDELYVSRRPHHQIYELSPMEVIR
jgi:hypothetical protein